MSDSNAACIHPSLCKSLVSWACSLCDLPGGKRLSSVLQNGFPQALQLSPLRASLWGELHEIDDFRKATLSSRRQFACVSALEACALMLECGVEAAPQGLRLLDVAEMVSAEDDTRPGTVFNDLYKEIERAFRKLELLLPPPPPLPVIDREGFIGHALHAVNTATLQGWSPVPAANTPPTLREFYSLALAPSHPLHIRGAISHWPALADPSRSWCNLSYLHRVAGPRTVPIEIGGSYLTPQFSVACVGLREYIATYLVGEGSQAPDSTVSHHNHHYLAQHALFEAIPALRADISIPEYTAVSAYPPNDQLSGSGFTEPSIKAWLGPAATYTPLHKDKPHNLLAQVVGAKKVRLLPPNSQLAASHAAQPPCQNTCTLTKEQLDSLGQCSGTALGMLFSVLLPGDMLYIPPGWWHECESLSTSFSVSFWWEEEQQT